MRTIVAILSLVGSVVVTVAQQQHADEESSAPSLLRPLPLPVRFQNKADDGGADAAASSQPTIIVGHEPNAYGYTYPYSKYAALSPTLTRIKRELQLGGQQQQQGLDGAAAEEEMLEHVVSLGDLVAELGNGHVENINDAQLKAEAAHVDGKTSSAADAAAAQDDFERGVAAYQATVELYQDAMTFFGGEEGEEHGSYGPNNDVVSLLAGISTIQLQLAELVMSDPSLMLLMLGPDGTTANSAALPVPISPEMLSPFYAEALRYNRDAIQSCERALELLGKNRQDASAFGGFDEEWSAQLELACADASVRLGSHIVECYEQGLIDMVLEASPVGQKQKTDNRGEGKLQSIVVSKDGATEDTFAASSKHHSVEDELLDLDDPLQIFGINGERVLKLARERFEKAAAIYRRSDAIVANAQDSHHDDRVQMADTSAAIGLVSLYLGDLTNSISMYEDSIELYSQLESEGYQHHFHDRDGGIPFIIADMLVQLSDVMLRAGRHDECDSRYQQAMDKFAKLAASSNGPSIYTPQPQQIRQSQFEGDDSLRLHEDALNDYYVSLGARGADALDDWGQDELDDPLYEGDLLFNIGTIHLSQDNLDEALIYLTKAITLYESSLEENEEGPLADALLNKASCLFYLGRYAESAATHEEAIEIYRNSVGEGGGEADAAHSFAGSNGSRSSRIRDRLINLDNVVLGIRNTTQTVL